MFSASPLALALLAASAPAGVKRLAVVDLVTPPTLMGLGAQVTQAIVHAATKQGYTVLRPERIQSALGAKKYQELQACGSTPSCVASRLGALGSDRAIVGSLDRDEKSYLLRLWHLDLARSQVVAEVDRAILIASRRFIPDATAAIPGLLRGEREARGTLKLTTRVQKVNVTVDGAPAGQTPLTLELKPGKHEVLLERQDYLPMRRLVAVEAGKVTEEEIRMLRAPGARPEEEAFVSVAARPQGGTEEGSGLRIPLAGWVGYGLALAAGGGAVYFGSEARMAERRLLAGYDESLDRYAGTRAEALKGRQDAVVANVLFGVSGTALATAVVLTVMETGRKAPAVQVAPAAGPGGAGVLVGGQF